MDILAIDEAAADAASKYALPQPGLRGLGLPIGNWVPLADHANPAAGNGSNSGTTNTFGHYRHVHKLFSRVRFSTVRLCFSNFYIVGFSGEFAGLNNINIKAGLELPSGTILPVFFSASRDAVIAPGASVWSDPIVLDALAGEYPYLITRTRVSVAAGGTWYPTSQVSVDRRSQEGMKVGTVDEDLTTAGTIPAANNTSYGPTMIVGDSPDWVPIVGISGDSVPTGSGDQSVALDGSPWRGFANRALFDAGIPAVPMAAPGDRVSDWLSLSKSSRRRAFFPGCDHVVSEYGINDFEGGARTFAQVAPDMIKAWRQQSSSRTKVWATTVVPFSTSTNAWADVAGQTASGSNVGKSAYNDWLRDGAPLHKTTFVNQAIGSTGANIVRMGAPGHPVSGYFEIADVVESSRNSGKWKAANRVLTDVAITGGSPTLTSASGAFTAADLGRAVNIEGAGSSGSRMVNRIKAVNSGTSVTLENSASTTVSAGTAYIGISTTDGVHPTSELHALMAAAIDTSKFLVRPA